jgi:diguanylate cyclase (GGDEF)-like protein
MRAAGMTGLALCAGLALWAVSGVGDWANQVLVHRIVTALSTLLAATLAWRAGRAGGPNGPARWFWRLLACAFLGIVGADVTSFFAALGDNPLPYGTGTPAGRAFALVTIVLAVSAILLVPTRTRAPASRLRLSLDLIIVLIAALVFVWYFLLGPRFGAGRGLVPMALTVVQASGVLVFVFAVARMILAGSVGLNRNVLRLIAAAALFEVVRVSLAASLTGSDRLRFALVAASICRGLILAAPLVELRGPQRHRPEHERKRRPVSPLPYVAIAATDVLLVVALTGGADRRSMVVLGGAITLTGLVIVRQSTLLTDNARLLGRLDKAVRREQLLAEAGTELMAARDEATMYQVGVRTAVALLDDFPGPRCLLGVLRPDWSATVVAAAGDRADQVLGQRVPESVPPELRGRLSAGEVVTVGRDEYGVAAIAGVAAKAGRGLLLPLLVHGKIMAVLSAASEVAITEEVTRSLETLRTQVTLALETAELTAELRRLALHDSLTRLANRAFLHERLHQALARARRASPHTAVLLLDLDGFKQINDTLGHHAGDEVLRQVAQRLRASVRTEDTPARLGGDEFAVLVEDLARRDDAVIIARRIIDALHPPIAFGDQEVRIRASIGIAYASGDHTDPDEIIRRADGAMYQAKRAGLGGYYEAEPPGAPVLVS